jgi:hypothetical protein
MIFSAFLGPADGQAKKSRKNQSYRTIFNEMNNTIDWIVLYPTE